MIAPRRTDPGVDAGLIAAVLGARAWIARFERWLAELCVTPANEESTEPDGFIDAILGLAALSARITQRAATWSEPAGDEPDAARATTADLGELLR